MIVASQLLGWLGLVLAVGWTVREAGRETPAATLGWRWWALIGLVLLGFRWPLLWTMRELNPDEGQLIAGAFTLRHDPLFWRSVDGHTAGPLVFYPLLPVAWSHGLAAFAGARLLALGLNFAALYCATRVLVAAAGPLAARAALLPAAAFTGLTGTTDFLFYSTELAPIGLLAAAAFLARPGPVAGPARWAAAGLLLGAAPWAKMQIGPLAAVVWAAVALRAWGAARSRGLAWLTACTLLPSVACFGILWATGLMQDWAVPFALNHFTFLGASPAALAEVAGQFWQEIVRDGYLASWLVGGLALAGVTAALAPTSSRPLRRFAAGAVLLLAVAALCILAPRRPYTHYLHLGVVPLLLATGAGLGLALAHAGRRRAALLVALFLAGTVGPQVGFRLAAEGPGRRQAPADLSLEERVLVACLRHYTTPGEALAIWGWRSSLYVGAGLRQATRQGQSEQQLRPNPWQSYFLRRYLDDLIAAEPPAFVDAVGPTNFAFQDRRRAHESFRALREWLEPRYALVLETGGTRVYVRRDRLAARGWWRPGAR